jgi:hypothetical protein
VGENDTPLPKLGKLAAVLPKLGFALAKLEQAGEDVLVLLGFDGDTSLIPFSRQSMPQLTEFSPLCYSD